MSILSASKTALVLGCGYWARPEVVRKDSGPKRAAALGLAVHDASEAKQTGKPIDLDAIAKARRLDDKQRAALPFMIDALDGHFVPDEAIAEISYAYNWRTGESRVLGRSLDRRYVEAGLLEDEIPGTADLVWFEDGGATVVVPDIKSGFRDSIDDHEDQLFWLANAAKKAHGAERAKIMTLPVGDDGKRAETRPVEDFELEFFEDRYRARVAHIKEGDPEPEPGPHCKDHWCPAITTCPKAAGAVSALIPAAQLVPAHRLTGPIASMEEAAYRLKMMPLVVAAAKAYVEEVKAYADAHDAIDTDDGPWGRIESPTTGLLPTPDVVAILERELGAAGVKVAVELEVTQASIKRAVQAAGIKPIAPNVERIVQEIKATDGATKIGTRSTYEVRRRGKGCGIWDSLRHEGAER